MKVRFYDNDLEIVEGIRANLPQIECIHVEEVTHPFVTHPRDPMIYSINYETAFPESYYIDILNSSFAKSKDQRIIPSQAITDDLIIELIDWCLQNALEEKVIFFDWDRTLACTEGYLPMYTIFSRLPAINQDLFIQTQLEYIMGGPIRLAKIQLMFRILHLFQVKIFIMTNNQGGLSGFPSYPYFCQFVKIVDPSFDLQHLIYSGASKVRGGKWFQLSKPQVRQMYKQAPIVVQRLPTQQKKQQARVKIQQLKALTAVQKQQGLKQVQKILSQLVQKASSTMP